MSTTPASLTVPLSEAARLLGMSESYARELERDGTFPVPVRRVGSWLRVSRADIDSYLNVPAIAPAVDPVQAIIDARIVALEAELAALRALCRPCPTARHAAGAAGRGGDGERGEGGGIAR